MTDLSGNTFFEGPGGRIEAIIKELARPVRIAGGTGRAVRIAGRAKATEDHPGRGSFLRRPLARISGRGIGLHRFDPVLSVERPSISCAVLTLKRSFPSII